MNTYCINLKNRPERWQAVQKECKKLNLKVERYGAVKRTIGYQGCMASHIQLLQRIKHQGIFMIIEDDFKVIGTRKQLDKSILELPDNWDMLYLGASFPTTATPLVRYTDSLYRLQGGLCTHAIMYNNQNRVAEFILNNLKQVHIDVVFMKQVQPKFNCYITYPMIATQQEGFSDIVNRHTDYSEITRSYKLNTR